MNTQETNSVRPRQAAQFLGIGESTLWRWAKERADFPPPIKLGPRTTVWKIASLAAFRDAQAVAASSAAGHPR